VLDGAAGADEAEHAPEHARTLERLAGFSLHESHEHGQAKAPIQDLTKGEARAWNHHVPVSVRVEGATAPSCF